MKKIFFGKIRVAFAETAMLLLLLVAFQSHGQQILDNGTMKLWGNILAEPTKKSLGGVTVGLYKGVIKIKETTSDKGGKFSIDIGSNTGSYKMVFTCPAYLTMYCDVNTGVPENKLPLTSGHEFIGLPMWPANTTVINIYAVKENPFTKIYLQGDKLKDDGPYLNWFAKKLLDMGEMATKKEMEEKEKLAKEKAEKDKLEKDKLEKLKKEQELLAKLEKEKLDKELAEKEKLEKLILAIDNQGGPKAYKVAKDADVTVVLYEKQNVKVNHAFKKGELNSQAVDKIVSEVPKILPSKRRR